MWNKLKEEWKRSISVQHDFKWLHGKQRNKRKKVEQLEKYQKKGKHLWKLWSLLQLILLIFCFFKVFIWRHKWFSSLSTIALRVRNFDFAYLPFSLVLVAHLAAFFFIIRAIFHSPSLLCCFNFVIAFNHRLLYRFSSSFPICMQCRMGFAFFVFECTVRCWNCAETVYVVFNFFWRLFLRLT